MEERARGESSIQQREYLPVVDSVASLSQFDVLYMYTDNLSHMYLSVPESDEGAFQVACIMACATHKVGC